MITWFFSPTTWLEKKMPKIYSNFGFIHSFIYLFYNIKQMNKNHLGVFSP